MLVLTATTDTIQVVLDYAVTANQLQCMSSWRDITTTTFTPGRTLVNTNGVTDVNAVAAPGASTQRVIDHLSIHNLDTVSAVVTVKFDANGTEYILKKVVLAPGERLEYADGMGWRVLGGAGAAKAQVLTAVTRLIAVGDRGCLVLAADVANSDAAANSIADVTGLSFPVSSGKTYYFRFVIGYTAAATGTGSRFAVKVPPTTLLGYRSPTALTTTGRNFSEGNTVLDQPTVSASSAATGANIAECEGFITPAADGIVQLRFAAEVASSAITAKAGSYVVYERVL